MPTYQRRAFLPRLMGSLLDDPLTQEVVIVVDGSTDGSIGLLRELAEKDPRVVPIHTPNQGMVAARRTGVEAASGDVVLILDDDVEAAPGLAANHARHHANTGGLVVIGYMPVANPNHSAAARLYSKVYETQVKRWEAHPDQAVRMLWAGNLSLRRVDYLAIASDVELYRYDYLGDQAFSFRCEAHGLTALFDPECLAIHHFARTNKSSRETLATTGGIVSVCNASSPTQHGRLVATISPTGSPPTRHGSSSSVDARA